MPLNRLTKRDKKNPNMIHTVCSNCEYKPDGCSGLQCAAALARRLAQYEDIGLSPAELAGLVSRGSSK